MADKVELGRVQGVGMFYTSAICTSATTTIAISSIIPSDVTVFVGDKVLCSTGELFTVASVNSSNLTVTYATSLMGARGEDGTSFEISYQVDSVTDLPTPTKELLGKAYAVGKESPHDIYVVAIDSSSNYYWLNLGQMQGPRGDKGDTGNAATIEVGEVETLEPDANVYVNNSGDVHNAVFDFGIPQGKQGEKGDIGNTPNISVAASVDQTIGTAIVTVTKSGSDEAPLLDFEFSGIKGEVGESGKAATIEVGEVETLTPGSKATVTNSGTTSSAKFDFGIPQGEQGVGVKSANLDGDNELTFTLTDGNVIDAGKVIPATSLYIAVLRDSQTNAITNFGGFYNGIATLNHIKYQLTGNQEVGVYGLDDTAITSVVIPNEIEIYDITNYGGNSEAGMFKVTSICAGAFRGYTSLMSITLPDTLISIESNAFHGCTSLASILFPDVLTSIGSDAFCGCTSLTSVIIPQSVTTLSRGVFSDCSNLSDVYYYCEDARTDHQYGIFCGYDTAFGLITKCKLHVMSTVRIVEPYIFAQTTYFTSIIFENGCTTISDHAFYSSSEPPRSTESITLPNTLLTVGDYAFYNAINVANLVIPNSVTSLGNYAFYNALHDSSSGIKESMSLRIGSSVSSIGDYCFYILVGSSYGTSIYFDNPNSFSIGNSAFYSIVSASGDFNYNTTIYYVGSESDWSSKVTVGGLNNVLTASVYATWQYNYS